MNEFKYAKETDIATVLEALSGPLCQASGIGANGNTCHPTAIRAALVRFEALDLPIFVERCKSWLRLHDLAFKMIACKNCGGKGHTYPNWMAFGDGSATTCEHCCGDGLGEQVTLQQYDDLARRIGKPLADTRDFDRRNR